MSAKHIALIIENGRFEVQAGDAWGQHFIARSTDLQECLEQARQVLGHPLVIPISGPNTEI
jgi:hypothetical protein